MALKFVKIAPIIGAVLAIFLAACGQRDASREAAMALAETIYPGELEFYDSHFRTTYYDVTLAVKDDPVTRITFQISPDPSNCVAGNRCEDRLRRAYDTGIARGETLKAIDRAFSICGVPVLAQRGITLEVNSPPIEPIIELDLRNDNQASELARLTPCLEAFWTENAQASWIENLEFLTLGILLQSSSGPTPAPQPLTFEARVPASRDSEPVYTITIARGKTEVSPAKLRYDEQGPLRSRLNERFFEAARQFLRGQPGGGHIPGFSFVWDMRLDPERIDMVRGYVLACSEFRQGQGPCREDIAVAMRYNLTTGAFDEFSRLEIVRDHLGSFTLPELPGR